MPPKYTTQAHAIAQLVCLLVVYNIFRVACFLVIMVAPMRINNGAFVVYIAVLTLASLPFCGQTQHRDHMTMTKP